MGGSVCGPDEPPRCIEEAGQRNQGAGWRRWWVVGHWRSLVSGCGGRRSMGKPASRDSLLHGNSCLDVVPVEKIHVFRDGDRCAQGLGLRRSGGSAPGQSVVIEKAHRGRRLVPQAEAHAVAVSEPKLCLRLSASHPDKQPTTQSITKRLNRCPVIISESPGCVLRLWNANRYSSGGGSFVQDHSEDPRNIRVTPNLDSTTGWRENSSKTTGVVNRCLRIPGRLTFSVGGGRQPAVAWPQANAIARNEDAGYLPAPFSRHSVVRRVHRRKVFRGTNVSPCGDPVRAKNSPGTGDVPFIVLSFGRYRNQNRDSCH